VDFIVISFTFLSLVARTYLFALSTEGERKRPHSGIEKLNLELLIGDGLRLSNQLVQPLFGNRAFASHIEVKSASRDCWLPVYEHAKPHGRSLLSRTHNEMKVAGVEAVRNPSTGLIQYNGLSSDCPIARKCPLITLQLRGDGI
jgi:hypothetical protein